MSNKKLLKLLEIADILIENGKENLSNELVSIYNELAPVVEKQVKDATQIKYYNSATFEEDLEKVGLNITYSLWENKSDGCQLFDICVSDLTENELKEIASIIGEDIEVLRKLDYICIYQ